MAYTQKQELSAEDSLKIIDRILYQTRHKLSDSKFAFLFWGYFVFALSLLHHFLWNAGVQYHWIGWTFTPLGWVVTALYYRRRKPEPVNDRVGKMFTWIWGVLGINLFLLGFLGHSYFGASFIAVLILAISWGILASGAILNFRPLIYGSIMSNVLAIAALIAIPFNYHLLLCAAAAVLCNIIPGHILAKTNA